MNNFKKLISAFSVSVLANNFGGDINGDYTNNKNIGTKSYYLTAKTYDEIMLVCYEFFEDEGKDRGELCVYKIEPSKFNDYTCEQLKQSEPYVFYLVCTVDKACDFISNYLVGLL